MVVVTGFLILQAKSWGMDPASINKRSQDPDRIPSVYRMDVADSKQKQMEQVERLMEIAGVVPVGPMIEHQETSHRSPDTSKAQ